MNTSHNDNNGDDSLRRPHEEHFISLTTTMRQVQVLLTILFAICGLSQAFLSPSRITRQEKTALSVAEPALLDGLSQAWASYNDALNENPLLVKSVTAGVILGAADLTGQALEGLQKEAKEIDVARAARFAFFGFVLQAPWNHFYYLLLDGALPPTPDPFTATTGIKVFIDQFIQAPIFTALIFAFLGTLEGKKPQDIKEQLDEDYVDTMFANCT